MEIKLLSRSVEISAQLAEILVGVVAAGGSVGFMHPLDPLEAEGFWNDALAAAARQERRVWGAFVDGQLAATVTLQLKLPPNQPHRAEIAKLMTRPRDRRKGLAAALMESAEAEAVRMGRTLLVLDTAVEDGAAGFYEKLGYTSAGVIPDYALKPHGGLTGTRIYWKRVGLAAPG